MNEHKIKEDQEQNIKEDQELYAYFIQRNETLVEDNYNFLTQRPEIKQLLNDYMASILLHKPDDVFKFTKDYFAILAEKPNIAKCLVITGPGGVGKGELIRKLVAEFPQILFACSHTTREKRKDEIEGKDYYFVSSEKFKELILKQEFIEHNIYYNNFYGTSKTEIKRNTQKDRVVLLEIDVNGANSIYQRGLDANYIGILPTDQDTLRARLKKRGTDSADLINFKLEKGVEEVAQIEGSSFYNYKIVNDDFQASYATLRNAVLALYPWLLNK